jgi:hypothetical protein
MTELLFLLRVHTTGEPQKVGRIWHQCDIPSTDSDVVLMISLSKKGTEFLFIVDLFLALSLSLSKKRRGGGWKGSSVL